MIVRLVNVACSGCGKFWKQPEDTDSSTFVCDACEMEALDEEEVAPIN